AKPAPKKAPPPPPPSLLDEVLDNPLYLAGGLGLLALLGGGAFLFMRRRRQQAEYGPVSGMTSTFPSDLRVDTATGKSGGGLVDTGNSSFLTDFDKTGPGTIDTDEVDPVAEAEVYIAYGRDAQAEEILKEAMARDKGRHEIPLKLLEIYHARKSATAFETVAKELRNGVGEGSPLWQKAAAMGAQIDPSNPLYGAAAAGTATYTAMAPAPAPAKPDVDFDLAGSSGGAPGPAPDFDLDLDSKKDEGGAPDLPLETSSGMDFDISSDAGAQEAPPPVPEPPKEEKPSFDFDLSGLDFPGSKPAASDLDVDPTRPAPSSSGLDLADLSLDGGGDAGDAGGVEGVGTKLELAKAYLEIGDKDGAREILQEVAKEGSSAQKDEAQKLISSL
ncbi:MAG TPA: FimV/HubP family polar landmark protein, partial [Myxococcota bacterium]|nr:FimV/HubP family polar landmark protein [Myxococcota bacterium]